MTRQEINKQILDLLTLFNEKMPHQRFNQLLTNVGILEGPSDRYYEESAATLERLLAAKETLLK